MSNQRLTGTLGLTRLIHVRMKKKGKDGKEVEGLFIPIEQNYLEKIEYDGKDGKVHEVVMHVGVVIKSETDERGQDGFVSKGIPSKVYKEATDEQKESLKAVQPILGNLKDWGRGSSNQAPPSNDVGSGQVYSDDDDLPF